MTRSHKVLLPTGIGRDPRNRCTPPIWGWLAALILTLEIGGPAVAQDSMPRPDNKAPLPEIDQDAAREIFQAMRQLQQTIRSQTADAAQTAKSSLPTRPVRTAVPPTLTSAELDRMIAQHLSSNDPKVVPAPSTSDVEFVRRVYFDIAGVPPSPGQVAAFLGDHARDKRARLIDALLKSPEYARNWGRYWRDVIRFHATNENVLQVRYDALETWLTERFARNAPWDEIARDLITATGRVDENGAVGFALAHESKPVELAGEVSRIFLGVQIQCAQCHDHKTDAWKREQFHEFAAFFSGTRSRPVIRGAPGQLPVFEVAQLGRARYAMPDLQDPKKQVPVAPAFFLAPSMDSTRLPMDLDVGQRRVLGASYVTGQDNPWFARAFVNRMWYVLMGESFYEGVDDLGPERTPRAREVVESLADQWQKGGYDVRWLLRTITNTHAYQRRVRSTANPAGKTAFASSCPSRLRSDQIIEALVSSLGLPTDLSAGSLNAGGVKAKKSAKEVGLTGVPGPAKGQAKAVRQGGPRVLLNSLFGVDPSLSNDEVLGSIPQALFLMNGPLVHSRTLARPGTPLVEILKSTPDNRVALNELYLKVLSRQPTSREVDTCAAYLSSVGNRIEAFEDIYWSLINTTEFISRR